MPFLLKRQRVLLRLLGESGGRLGRLGLVKLAFKLAHDSTTGGGASFYDFLPYRFGPYSFTLARELDTLATLGLLSAPDDNAWAITAAGTAEAKAVTADVVAEVELLCRTWASRPVSALVDHVYERHPWFTVNADQRTRRRAERPVGKPAVHTVGYEGLSVDAFLDLLMRSGVAQLVDVRANPISRRYGFHKSTLARLCGNVDIEYVHVPELGIASSDRVGLEEDAREALFARYGETTLATGKSAVARVAEMLKAKPSAILCQEADPARCHRAHLARALQAATNLPVVNLGWPR